MDPRVIVGIVFAIIGLYCVVMPSKAKLNLRLGRFDDRTNFDWMSDGWVRIMGVGQILLGTAIAKGWLWN
jgi:hypothetical protein